jgi:hypothetical protein
MLNKEEFKKELKSVQIFLQKEYDSQTYLNKENKSNELEESCLIFRKILHILDI